MRAMLPRVSPPGGSPYCAASGIAPIPTLSRTIQITRRNTTFEGNTQCGRTNAALMQRQDSDYGTRGLLQLPGANTARCIQYDPGIGGEQPIGPNATRMIQAARIE